MQCQDVEATAHLMGCLSLGVGPITIRRRDRGSIGITASGLKTKTLYSSSSSSESYPTGYQGQMKTVTPLPGMKPS